MTNTNTHPTTTDPTAAHDAGTGTPCPVSWFELHSADPERVKAFYAAVFGWSFDDAMPGYSFVELGDDAPVRGGIAATGGDSPNAAVFNIEVPDVAASLASITAHGGSALTEVQSMPNGLTFAYAANPDGSVFGIWCPPAG